MINPCYLIQASSSSVRNLFMMSVQTEEFDLFVFHYIDSYRYRLPMLVSARFYSFNILSLKSWLWSVNFENNSYYMTWKKVLKKKMITKKIIIWFIAYRFIKVCCNFTRTSRFWTFPTNIFIYLFSKWYII